MKKLSKILASLMLAWVPLCQAQHNPGLYEVLQKGVKVGEIYVPARDKKDTRYLEQWVLYPRYIDPDEKNGAQIMITEALKETYRSEKEFLEKFNWEEGYRHVRVYSVDMDSLPVVR